MRVPNHCSKNTAKGTAQIHATESKKTKLYNIIQTNLNHQEISKLTHAI